VGLLVGDADHLGELLLGQTQHDPTFADPRAHVMVGSVGAGAGPGIRIDLAGPGGLIGGVPGIDGGIVSFGHERTSLLRQ
jgi:hypothetical protein